MKLGQTLTRCKIVSSSSLSLKTTETTAQLEFNGTISSRENSNQVLHVFLVRISDRSYMNHLDSNPAQPFESSQSPHLARLSLLLHHHVQVNTDSICHSIFEEPIPRLFISTLINTTVPN